MRKLLTCTTALSVALSTAPVVPAHAQTVAEDGSVIGPDGAVICVPTPDQPCDLEVIMRMLRDAEAVAAEAEAARVAAEAEAARAAEEAARAAAEAEAARVAAEEEAARAAAAAEEEAARAAAEAEAARVAAEEEAARVTAEEEAAAAAEAAEEPAAEPADEPAMAEPAAGPEPAVDPAGEPPAAVTETPDAAGEPGDGAAEAAEPAAGPGAEAAPAEDAAAAEDPAATDPAPDPAAVTEAEPAPEPVDAPVVSEEAAVSLESILAAPTVTEEAAAPETGAEAGAAAEPAAPAMPEAAAVLSTPDAPEGGAAEAVAADPVAVVSEVVSEGTTRSSDEEFAAAPVAVAEGKKSGLSDLEKVGLVALGALVVGAVINQGNKEQKTVVSNSGDRVVVQNSDGSYTVYKDDDAVLRRPGVETTTETYRDGSTRTVVKRDDGTQVVTIRDASGRVLRRATYDRNGNEAILIDDLYPEERIDITRLPPPRPDRVTISTSDGDAALKAELAALEAADLGRKFSLRQIREIREVRSLAAMIEVDSITFDTGSAAIKATEARKLADIGRLMQELLAANPREVFLIEGHTDAVGSAASNLSLSDRRAESMALALTEYFDIPPENLVVQGYGEAELKVASAGDERANRRVVVRLVTPLMRTAELR